jgi:hypothetical protein
MNGARSLLATLVDAGVDVCFSNPGTSEMHFVAALDDVPAMRGILTVTPGSPAARPPLCCISGRDWVMDWPTCTTPAEPARRWSTLWATTPPTTPASTLHLNPTLPPLPVPSRVGIG